MRAPYLPPRRSANFTPSLSPFLSANQPAPWLLVFRDPLLAGSWCRGRQRRAVEHPPQTELPGSPECEYQPLVCDFWEVVCPLWARVSTHTMRTSAHSPSSGPWNPPVLGLWVSPRIQPRGGATCLAGMPPPPDPFLVPSRVSSPLFGAAPSSCSSGPGREPGLARLWLRPMRENRLKVQPLFSPGRKICSIRSVKRSPFFQLQSSTIELPSNLPSKKTPLALDSTVPGTLPLPSPAPSAKGHSDLKHKVQAVTGTLLHSLLSARGSDWGHL